MLKKNQVGVFYDGTCPICFREIAFYKRCKGAGEVEWVDISVLDGGFVIPGLSKEKALNRFHVRRRDGVVVSGGKAFAALWCELPSFYIVGKVCQIWPVSAMLELAYIGFLLIRPKMRRFFRKR